MPAGRPTDYTQELADTICSLLAEGKSVRSVALREDMPGASTMFRWLRDHKEFREQYARAKEESSDALYEELADIGEQAIEAALMVDPKSSNAVVSAHKLKADNLKWSMSKMKPKRYGDKLDVTSDGEKLPTPIYGGKSRE